MTSVASPRPPVHWPDALGVSGGVLCLLILGVIALIGQSKGAELVAYLVLFFVVPLLSVALVTLAAPLRPLAMPIMSGKIFLAAVLAIACALVICKLPQWQSLSLGHVLSIAVSGALACTALFVLAARRWRVPAETLADPILVVALVLALILFSPIDPALPLASTMLEYVRETPRFGRWIVGGVAYVVLAVLVGVWEGRTAANRAAGWRGLALVLALIFAASLYDDGHWADIGHYAPLIGPALHSQHGGIPMVDIYCQYGLAPWLLIRAMFAVWEPSAGNAAIVVRVLNVAFFMTVIVITFVVSVRRVRAILLLIPILLAGIAFHASHQNLNGLPSAQGMRYLLPMLMALLLTIHPPKPWIPRAATAILVVASFWSIETFLFTLLAWGGHATVDAIRHRSGMSLLRRIAIAFGLIAAAHVAFVFGVYVLSGRIVDYVPYADMFLGFLLGRGDWPWPMAMKPGFLWWIPVWFSYFLTVALSVLGAIRRQPEGIADRLLAVALVGIGALSYYAGRSSETTLGLSFLPFGVLLVRAYEHLADVPSDPTARRFAVGGLLTAILALVFSFGLERFSRPLDVLKGNSTILRRCFGPEGCSPLQVARRIRGATRMIVDYRYPPVPKLAEMPVRVAELVGLLRAHAPTRSRVPMLVAVDGESVLTWFYGLMAFQQTGQWYSWRTSSPVNDAISPILARSIVASATVRDGDPVVLAKDDAKLIKLEQEILSKIRGACRLVKVGESDYFAAFRVEDCRWEH